MKRLMKFVSITMAITMLSSVTVMAGNINTTYSFTTNGQKINSSGAGLKSNDGDPLAYVTTLAKSNSGTRSTLFSNGGTFYARTRLDSNREGVYSPLFTFTSNTSKKAAYSSGMAKFGSYYIMRCETSNADFAGRKLIQATRWCP